MNSSSRKKTTLILILGLICFFCFGLVSRSAASGGLVGIDAAVFTSQDPAIGITYFGTPTATPTATPAIIAWANWSNGPTGNTIITFDVATPGTFTTIGPTGPLLSTFINGVEFGGRGGGLHLTTDISTDFLYSVNRTTGAATLIGGSGLIGADKVGDLSWDLVGDRMLAIATPHPFGGGARLYEVNLETGALTNLGTITGLTDDLAVTLAVRADGVIYAHGVETDRYYTIDRTTLAATPLPGLGVDTSYGQGANFAPNGTLYHAMLTTDGGNMNRLATIDQTTGAPTFIGTLGGPALTQLGDIAFEITTGPTPAPTPTPTPSTFPPCPPGPPSTYLFTNFDNVTVPTLPVEWTAINDVDPDGVLWQTSNAGEPSPPFYSAPNAAWVNAPGLRSDKYLTSWPYGNERMIWAQLRFRHNFDFENGFDGGVLEIKSPGAPSFIDILAAGGSFISGGYNSIISSGTDSPIAGRAAWSGNSGEYVTTIVNLPAYPIGGDLRWRMATDTGQSGAGWRIDEVRLTLCSGPGGTPTSTPTNTPTATPTFTPTPTPTATPTNTPTGTPTPTPTVSPTVSPTPTCTPDLTEGFIDITTLVPAGWNMQNRSTTVGSTNWFQGFGAIFSAHSGPPTSYIGANFNNTTGANTISNWLLTPVVTLQDGAVMTFYTRTVNTPAFPDRLQVRMSTNGDSTAVGTTATSVGDFTSLLLDINPTYTTTGYPNGWTQFAVIVTGVPTATTGRFAFRYFVENGGPTGANSDYIGIDTVAYARICLPTLTPTPTATPTPNPTATPTVTPTATPTTSYPMVLFRKQVHRVEESETAFVEIVRISNTTIGTSVQFTTVSSTATGGPVCDGTADYINATQTVNFAPGAISNFATVQICGDNLIEDIERVDLRLTGTFVFPGQDQAVLFISNNAGEDFDYDADGKSDISVFRPSVGNWYLQRSSAGFAAINFGIVTDKIVPADYDGDGKTDLAVYRPSAGTWYIANSSDGTYSHYVFGLAEDLPTPADYDGDRKADISVFRPSAGTWYRLSSSTGEFMAFQFGTAGDSPTLGDFDGDSRSDLGVFRPSTGAWYHMNSSNGTFFGEQFGLSTDRPVPSDYDGDGTTDIAIYRPSEGLWYFKYSRTNTYVSYVWGLPNDIAAPADFDGDRRVDIAVWRPSIGHWYIVNSANSAYTIYQFGQNGDIPTQNSYGY